MGDCAAVADSRSSAEADVFDGAADAVGVICDANDEDDVSVGLSLFSVKYSVEGEGGRGGGGVDGKCRLYWVSQAMRQDRYVVAWETRGYIL